MSLIIGKGVVEWIAKRTGEFNCFGTDVGIGWQRDGEIVAGVAYANWNGVNVECHTAVSCLLEPAARLWLRTIFDYPFCQLKVNRITVCVGEGNTASRRFVEKLGFQLETTLAAADPSGDILIYRMWKKDCRWLGLDSSKQYALAA